MTSKLIHKRSDPLVRHLKKIREGEISDLLFCEGLILLEEATRSSIKILAIYCLKQNESEIKKIRGPSNSNISLTILSKEVMDFVSDLKTPPGIITITSKPIILPLSAALKKSQPPFIAVLHKIQLPQNVGALVRTAEASNVTEVWTTSQSADPFGPKALRGSSGSIFRIPIRTNLNLAGALYELKSHNLRIFAATQTGQIRYDEVPWDEPVALVLGSEALGFSKEELSLFQNTIRIPMSGQVESLNVGVAGAICFFEAKKFRESKERAS